MGTMLSYLADKFDKLAEEAEGIGNENNGVGAFASGSAAGVMMGGGIAADAGEREIVVLTGDKRLVICGFPGTPRQSKIPPPTRSLLPTTIPKLRKWIEATHNGRAYVVWNLSGESYDYTVLQDNVVEYQFPGFPAPPVNTLIEMAEAIKSWLEADSSNVAILHDISGRRSAVVATCVLLMMRAEQLQSSRSGMSGKAVEELRKEILEEVCAKMGKPGKALVPSQVRYTLYFKDYLVKSIAGVNHRKQALYLQRVIVNGVPDFVNTCAPNTIGAKVKPVSCRPFMKLMQGGKVIGGTLPEATYLSEDTCFSLLPKFPYPKAGIESKEPVALNGDLLLQVFHQSEESNGPIPMFSLTFNTDYVMDNVLRLSMNEIDGASRNARFPRFFFLDLIFSSASVTSYADEPEKETERDHTVVTQTVHHSDSTNQEQLDPISNKFEKSLNRSIDTEASVDSITTALAKTLDNMDSEALDLEVEALRNIAASTNQKSPTSPRNIVDEIDNILNGEDDDDDLSAFEARLDSLGNSPDDLDLDDDPQHLADEYQDNDEDFDLDEFASSLNGGAN